MYLKRKIDEYLLEWKKNEERLPLIIKGARQIGKTESINHFAEQNYSNIVSINFVLEPKYKTILSDGYAVEDIIKNISMIDTSKKFIAGDTVIIFDELQEFPDIATALKSFRIDGRFDVICSGSLLGINYRKIHSNSVGYKTDYEMFSMDFEEFLWAKGYSEKHIEDILKHMQTGTPFSETELSVYKKLFLEYCVLGGMPAVVKVYIEKNLFIVKDLLGQNLVLPDSLIFFNSDGQSIDVTIQKTKCRIVMYVDSIGCISCKLKLAKWKQFIVDVDSLSERNTSFLFYYN